MEKFNTEIILSGVLLIKLTQEIKDIRPIMTLTSIETCKTTQEGEEKLEFRKRNLEVGNKGSKTEKLVGD